MTPEERARAGWESDFPGFRDAPPARVRESLQRFLPDSSPEQIRAWSDAIPPLQREIDKSLLRDNLAEKYSAILEYELPMESRRPDVILLVGAAVMVIELKGKLAASQADIDQASAYARDLRCYHAECDGRSVLPVVVPTRAKGYLGDSDGVVIVGPDALDDLVNRIAADRVGPFVDRDRFLSEDAYRPLPTLVAAARELFESGTLRTIERAHAATAPAVEAISRTIHQASLTNSRHLILVTGLPGSGKTLVGLKTVHSRFLDDLAVPRAHAKSTVSGVFLSGNAPLVRVLQYELRSAGGDGKTFVRNVRDYVESHTGRRSKTPSEHVLVFDEAQRAFDAVAVARTHNHDGPSKSEPELFIEFANRVPSWCVVVGLIGIGQEIHAGEEAGVAQWKQAVEESERSAEWTIHVPPSLKQDFAPADVPVEVKPALGLDRELRYHGTEDLHRWVGSLLEEKPAEELAQLASQLAASGFHLRGTRSLETAKAYLRDRYRENAGARFGMLASSRDKSLAALGVPNDFQSRQRLKLGPWYADGEESELSCRRLGSAASEFESQGLELDASLLVWGTDLLWTDGAWSIEKAARYVKKMQVRDPKALRLNAYRVLLTRGRDATVIVVPHLPELGPTWRRLQSAGVRPLKEIVAP